MSFSDDIASASVGTHENLSFEKALALLEDIVGTLEKADAPLDDSIRLYEKGMALKSICEKRLQDAMVTIEQIAPDAAESTTE